MPDALAPLAHREFRLLFAARTISFAGNGFTNIALAFAVLDLTGSATDLGFVLAARFVPQVLFVLVGGIWADRLPRQRVLLASNVASGVTQGALAAALLAGDPGLWLVVVLAALNGTSTAFFYPASQGIVPETVPASLLQRANAVLRFGLNASLILGLGLAGVIVAATNPGVAIAVDAASYFAGALLVAMMRLPPGLVAGGGSFLHDLGDGWHEVRSRTWLWALVLQFAFVNGVENGARLVLGPAVARESLGGAGAWGAIQAMQCVGLAGGALSMAWLRPRRILRAAIGGVCAMPVVLVALAVPLPLAGVLAAAFVTGVGVEIFGVLWDTAVQQTVPPERLSRVNSFDALGSIVLIPLGVVAAGPVAAAIGTRATLLAASAVILISCAAVFALREVRNFERGDRGSAAAAGTRRFPRPQTGSGGGGI